MKFRGLCAFLLVLLLSGVFPQFCLANDERTDGYFTIYDEKTNKKIFATARMIHIGDQYLDEKNNLYEIVRVEGDKGYAVLKEKIDLGRVLKELQLSNHQSAMSTSYYAEQKRTVAIYHTHSDESYVPTDGKASIPYNGGIFKVGKALKKALEERGITVLHSERPHDPHDAAAYERSRRTAMELLKQNPDAILDIHRDAVPAEEYTGQVNGQPVAKVQLVVGRQNPQMKTINNFAWQIKAVADKKYPGLIKGIFYGKGNYNQDLFPRTILIEAGTYTNYREKAQDGVQILADVIATTLYGTDYQKKAAPGGGSTTQVPRERGSALRSMLGIVVVGALGFIGYMLISTGGWKELSSKIGRFMGTEFANFLGNIRRDKKDNDNSSKRDES
ncbi:stage II sporulation protein P [Thermovorax subterraneus]|jgi:stage II sporulation protein P|nr:stage II sporulation protein P [Thermovorax subterraneus]